MKKLDVAVKSIIMGMFILTCASLAHGQQRTFVSGTGNDANACTSVTAPCRTFQRGHNAVAAGGEVVALNSAGYGPLSITKSVTISGEGIRAAVTSVGAGNGVTINAPAVGATVILRELTITGIGTGDNGIEVTDADNVYIEQCVVTEFTTNGILYNTNGRLFVTDTVSRDNDVDGIEIIATGGTARVNIDHSRFERNFLGIDLCEGTIEASITNSIASDNVAGIGADSTTGIIRVNIAYTTAANNGFPGFTSGFGFNVGNNANNQMNIEYSVARGNSGHGMQVFNVGTMRVSNSVSTNNLIGFSNGGGTFESRVNNTVAGNTNPNVGAITPLAAL